MRTVILFFMLQSIVLADDYKPPYSIAIHAIPRERLEYSKTMLVQGSEGKPTNTTKDYLVKNYGYKPSDVAGLTFDQLNRVHAWEVDHRRARTESPATYPRILFFTASYCIPCQQPKTQDFPWLEASNWRIDKTEQANLQIVDIERQPELMEQYGVATLPTFVLITRKGEVARSGYAGRKTYETLLKELK